MKDQPVIPKSGGEPRLRELSLQNIAGQLRLFGLLPRRMPARVGS